MNFQNNGNHRLIKRINQLHRTFFWIFALFCLLLVPGVACADSSDLIPLPHEFWGSISINGDPAPVGTTITALIDGEECGSVTTTAEGWYGGTNILEGQHLIVSGTSDQINKTIIFMINGMSAENTAIFTPGTASLLDIYVYSGDLPIAAFTATPSTGNVPLAVQFTDGSTNGPFLSWQWDFSDGSTSTEQNPSHIFTNPGEYRVNLTVTNTFGSSYTSKTVTVTDSTPPHFEITTVTDFDINTMNISAVASKTLTGQPTVVVIKNGTTPVPVTTLSWNPATRTYLGSFSIAGLTAGNHSYAISITGMDLYNNTGTGEASGEVSIRAIPAETPTNIYTKGSTSVNIVLNGSTASAAVSVTEYTTPEDLPADNISIAALSIDVDSATRNLLENITIHIPFTAADVAGTTGDLSKILKIYYYDTAASQWIVLDSTVYGDRTSGGYVEAVINHLTVFSLMTAQGPFSLSNVVATPATNSAVVTWTTNKAATSKIYWGQSAAYSASFASGTQKLSHAVTLTGLNASTIYHYKVESYNASTATTISSTDLTFTTRTPTPPSPSGGGGGGGGGGAPSGFVDFAGGEVVYETTGSLSLNWDGYVELTTRIETVDGDISVIVPAGTKAKNAEGGDLNSITVQAVGNLPAPAEGFTFAGKAVQCTPGGATFDPAVKISFELTEDDWAALGSDQTFTIMAYNDGAGRWEEIPTIVLSGSRRVLGDVSHFSTYGLFITGASVQQGTIPTNVQTAMPTGTPTETATSGFEFSVAVLSLGVLGLFFLRRK